MRTHERRNRSHVKVLITCNVLGEGAAPGLWDGEEAGGSVILGNGEAWLPARVRSGKHEGWTGTTLALVLLRD